MKILFFDTETTGKIEKNAPIEMQPHVVQFGAVVGEYEEDGSIISEETIDLLFNPGIPIPEEAASIHGVHDADVIDKPPFSSYRLEFIRLCSEADVIVAHNIEYDMKVCFWELDRFYTKDSQKKNDFKNMFCDKSVCTMQSTIDFCRLPGKFGKFKFPKLSELHVKLFGKDFDNAHNAVADIVATRACFFEILQRGLITIKK